MQTLNFIYIRILLTSLLHKKVSTNKISDSVQLLLFCHSFHQFCKERLVLRGVIMPSTRVKKQDVILSFKEWQGLIFLKKTSEIKMYSSKKPLLHIFMDFAANSSNWSSFFWFLFISSDFRQWFNYAWCAVQHFIVTFDKSVLWLLFCSTYLYSVVIETFSVSFSIWTTWSCLHISGVLFVPLLHLYLPLEIQSPA